MLGFSVQDKTNQVILMFEDYLDVTWVLELEDCWRPRVRNSEAAIVFRHRGRTHVRLSNAVGLLPWSSVAAQTGAASIMPMNRPESFRMKRSALSDRRAIPEGFH